MTKKGSKEKAKNSYEEFWRIYNPKSHLLSKTLMNRIEAGHYGYAQINRIVCALQWFEEEYGSGNYRIRLNYTSSEFGGAGNRLFLDIYDNDPENLWFATYKYYKGDNGYIAENCAFETDMAINLLDGKGKYNPEIHRVV